MTLRDLKFPWLYVLEVLLLVPLMGAFVGVISFLAARPVGSLDLKGRALPAGWTAAYPNHGRYLRGYLIADHRLAFAALLILILLTVLSLHRVYQARLRQAARSPSPAAHRIAHGVVFSVWVVLAWTLVMRVLVGVDPR